VRLARYALVQKLKAMPTKASGEGAVSMVVLLLASLLYTIYKLSSHSIKI